MLLAQDAPSQIVLGISGQNRHCGLSQDRPRIQLLGNKVDRAAVQLHPGLQRTRVRIQARE